MSEDEFLMDDRTPQQKQVESTKMRQINNRNMKNFGVQLSGKQKINYEGKDLERIDLEEGWFCMITDNHKQSQTVVVTIHGCPGDYTEWRALDALMECRWINLALPGCDGYNDSRGSYVGTIQQLVLLIKRMLGKLGIKRIVACGHSFGTFVWTYFMYKHPQLIEGFINIAGILDYWYIGMYVYYGAVYVQNEFGSRFKAMEDMNNKQVRQRAHRHILKWIEEVTFGNARFRNVSESEMMVLIKVFASAPEGNANIYYVLSRKVVPDKLKLYLFGEDDPLQEIRLCETTAYRRMYGELDLRRNNEFMRRYNAIKKDLEYLQQKYQVKLDYENYQSNFYFNFPDTGHNVHKRRPNEIAKIIKVYLESIEKVRQADSLSNSKL